LLLQRRGAARETFATLRKPQRGKPHMSTSASELPRMLASSEPSPASSALRALRGQAAYLRALLDEVERLAPSSTLDEGLTEQVVEELARLGCRSLEAASELTHVIRDASRERCG
jgi:hypothetical protein